jgi:glycosyltransferase involved in cell wall biosynthesis
MKKPRILILIQRASGGGAQRVAMLLAHHLAARFQIALCLLNEQKDFDCSALSPQLEVFPLGVRRARGGFWPLLKLIWRWHPDLIFSGMAHVNFLLLLLRPFMRRRIRLLVRQNGTISAALEADRKRRRTRFLYRWLYPRADRIICQSEAMARDLAREVSVPRDRIAVLANPVAFTRPKAAGASAQLVPWKRNGARLLAIGRLAPEKGFDVLLEAVGLLCAEHPQLEAAIAGSGSGLESLQMLARRLGIEARVHFVGQIADPEPLFASATLFVLSSRYEGMPNALLEAAASGLPLVATPASGGIVELLKDQKGCWLSQGCNAVALASALRTALRQIAPLQRCEHPFMQPYRLETAVEAYAQLFLRVLDEAGR